MNNFFNSFKKKDDKSGGQKLGGGGNGGGPAWGGGGNATNNDKNAINNPFSKFTLPGSQRKKFTGGGQSLGGSQPGKVIEMIFTEPGPLGMRIEKRQTNIGTAIVAEVVPGSQAEKVGVKRGDILCYHGSNGQDEVQYEQFVSMARCEDRPLYLEVRRITVKSGGNDSSASADAYNRKQAMIAAAEAREKANKFPNKSANKSNSEKNKHLPAMMNKQERHELEKQRLEQLKQQSQEPKSMEAKKAMEDAKAKEAHLANQLGYNPYEASKATAGQARNATVAVTHGTIADNKNASASSSSSLQQQQQSLPTIRPPQDPTRPIEDSNIDTSIFDEAYTVIISTNDKTAVVSSFNILRKLIINATTKGQDTSKDGSEKFRRVRLANEKIKNAVVDVHGAFDLMTLIGFQLIEEDNESYLIFPLDNKGPNWLPKALQQMEKYCQ